GVTFSRAYTASPLCSPTRSAILTGLSPARTGVTTPSCHLPQLVLAATAGKKAAPDHKATQPIPVTRLKTEYRTLAESLKDAGYVTGHFGKWHLGREPYSPLEQGFDVDVPHWPGPGPAGSYVAPWKFEHFDPDPDVPNQHIEDRMAAEAVAFMEKHKDETFFLNYWMFSVHAPFDAKRKLIAKYAARVNAADPQRCPTYAAMIESMDDAVGTLLDAIDRLGLAQRTIIVFTSDNGGNMYSDVDGDVPTSNAPLRGGKATMYEGGTRVPAVVVMPGVAKPGSTSDIVIQSEDYYPTLLAAARLKPAAQQAFDGVNILSAVQGEALAREAVFQYFPHSPGVPDWLPPSVSVHRGDWKLIRIFHGGENGRHRWLLFNLREDLGETNNLAAEKPEVVQELDALIESFLSRTNAVLPAPNPDFDPAKYDPASEGRPKPKPQRKAAAPASADSDPAVEGWTGRQWKATVTNGVVVVEAQGDAPFLGVAAGVSGPATVRLRVRCGAAGAGKVEWIPRSGSPASVPYELRADDWQVVTSKIPATGPLGIVRIYLPAQQQPVEVDWIELQGEGKSRRWDWQNARQ
ncbi:MAG: sulfatase, partial [Planctomycetales bacterium]|nr:sulfatase [Planctomycetales bacterium]